MLTSQDNTAANAQIPMQHNIWWNMEIWWNAALTIVCALLGALLKDRAAEISRLGILLNKTREEIAKEYVTRTDVHNDINRVLDRLDRFELKLDTLISEKRNG
jgi:predicted DNA-binding protein YlxM (UPF0122 family)